MILTREDGDLALREVFRDGRELDLTYSSCSPSARRWSVIVLSPHLVEVTGHGVVAFSLSG